MMKKIAVMLIWMGLSLSGPAWAQEIGQIKKMSGQVVVERAGQRVPATAGMKLLLADTIKTGRDGAVGITLTDNTLLSAGPESTLALSKYAFDTTTHQGESETALRRGTLSVVTGKLAKQSPAAVQIKTPATIIGVRGTEFLVQVEGEKDE